MNNIKIAFLCMGFAILLSIPGIVTSILIGNITPEENNTKLEKQIEENLIVIKQLEKNYLELWEENQLFSSMLSEIENEPGGHEILKKLWDKNQGKQRKNKPVFVWLLAKGMLYLGIIEKREKIKVMKRIRIEDRINLNILNVDDMFNNVSFYELAQQLMEAKEMLEQQGWTHPKIQMEYSYDGC